MLLVLECPKKYRQIGIRCLNCAQLFIVFFYLVSGSLFNDICLEEEHFPLMFLEIVFSIE